MSIVKSLTDRMMSRPGESAYQAYRSNGGTLTEAQWLASLAQGAPEFAANLEECIDQSKMYVLPDGYIYAYTSSDTPVEVVVPLEATSDNPYTDDARLGSDGSNAAGYPGYVTTPYIDLLAYPVPFTLHLDGAVFFAPETDSYTRCCTYTADKTLIKVSTSTADTAKEFYNLSSVTVDDNGNAALIFNSEPHTNNDNHDAVLRYARYSGKGTSAEASIYATYTQQYTGETWRNTGIRYSADLTQADLEDIAQQAAALIDAQLLTVIGDGEIA